MATPQNAQELIALVTQMQTQIAESQQREAQLRQQVDGLLQQAQQTQQQLTNGPAAMPANVGAAFEALATTQREFMESMKSRKQL